MTSREASIAATRFGLGPRPGDLERIASDPRGWLHKQINPQNALPETLNLYPGSDAILSRALSGKFKLSKDDYKRDIKKLRQQLQREVADRLMVAIDTPTPLAERLVLFWSNHFTVSGSKGRIKPALGAFEREVIRPHVFGNFHQMLLASSQHICMIAYLDNQASTGPNSRVGRKRKRDLNENLAREILELHTLGVNGGYTQSDVTEFAKVLTGWSHSGRRAKRNAKKGLPTTAKFEFVAAQHEPGTRTVLGRQYPSGGLSQGLNVLESLSIHRSTARHIATKLVRHFVADDAPKQAVAIIESVFQESGGDLAAVSHALIELEAAWQSSLSKIKTPYEFVVSAYRAVGQPPKRPNRTLAALRLMGHAPFHAPSPAGWPDVARHWISPGALLRRIEWVRAEAATFDLTMAPDALLNQTMGPLASPTTLAWVRRAPSPAAATAMVLASREFQRR